MSRLLFLSIVTLLVVLNTMVTIVYGVTSVVVTSPVSPVRQGGILSVHCHIQDLTDKQEVTILHTPIGGNKNRLTWDEGVVTGAEDRVFLAIRQLNDGSMVHFLSIVEAERQDAGEYSCRVFNTDDMKEVASDTVHIDIQYFPEEPYPLCEPMDSIVVYSGSSIVLNCSSEVGSPPVSMQWIKTGSDKASDSDQVINNGISYSELHLRPTMLDNEAVFLCQITSVMFPDKPATCHVGPIMVIPTEEELKDVIIKDIITPTRKSVSIWKTDDESSPSNKNHECDRLCNLVSDNSTFTWIVATCVSAIIAVIFCIVGVAISIKLYKLPRLQRDSAKFKECIYEDVDRRGVVPDNKVYMALKTSSHQPFDKTLLPPGHPNADHYAITLCRPTPNL